MPRSVRMCAATAVWVAATGTAACGGVSEPASAAQTTTAGAASKTRVNKDAHAQRSRLVPDLAPDHGIAFQLDGEKRILTQRLRARIATDGTIERARELLPIGRVQALEMPSRLGGGFVFLAVGGNGTQLFRAPTWLGELTPLTMVTSVAAEQEPLVPGFDRLYLRLKSGNSIVALDAMDGKAMSLGPLPTAPAYGDMLFVDGWRGIVDTDLRGALATFDAGASWRPLPIAERITGLTTVDGDPAAIVDGGLYVVDARGGISFRKRETPKNDSPEADVVGGAAPLGDLPLRAAVEDGFPVDRDRAVVARKGVLAEVSLVDGRVLHKNESAFDGLSATCTAVRLGSGWGFVCGEPEGSTRIFSFASPLSMREVLSFDEPRFVSASGNGALVIRGTCPFTTGGESSGDRAYCIRDVDGTVREIRVRGELGAERVVALANGKVAVIVPPLPGTSGQLSIIDGSDAKHIPLKLPAEPRGADHELRRGMWLEGFYEKRPGVLGGWVEAGGPLVGIEISAKGMVTAGDVMSSGGGALTSGRYALVMGDDTGAVESTDGGMTFEDVDIPPLLEGWNESRSRGCGPAGCVVRGWIRTGWGETAVENDLAKVEKPEALYVSNAHPVAARIQLQCALSDSNKPTAETDRQSIKNSWPQFRGVDAPTLSTEELGVSSGSANDLVGLQTYAWGRRGADWTRAGKWQIRFDDRYDLDGVRSSAITAPPFVDDISASRGLGVGGRGHSGSWHAFLDPGGDAAIASMCSGRLCSLYSVADRLPIVPLRDQTGPGWLPRPSAKGAVRVGSTWYFLSAEAEDSISIYRVELGAVRQIASLNRPARSRFNATNPPTLVRRAYGNEVGLLVTIAPDPRDPKGEYYVLPIEPSSGELGDPIPLGTAELGRRRLSPCEKNRDGWLLELPLENPEPIIKTGSISVFDAVEARVRVDPGYACIQSLAGRSKSEPVGQTEVPAGPTVDFVVSVQSPQPHRRNMRCLLQTPAAD